MRLNIELEIEKCKSIDRNGTISVTPTCQIDNIAFLYIDFLVIGS